MAQEVVFLGHDNYIDLVLKENDTAVDLAAVAKMTLSLGTVLLESTNNATHSIRWNVSSYSVGECRIFIVNTTKTIRHGAYDAPLVVYDTTFANGIVWGTVPILIKNDPEAT